MKRQPRPVSVAERLIGTGRFPHKIRDPQVLETHISWVILTGDFAYKIKKPVAFDFVDFSTLALRKRYCELEVELNRRFAPDLYLGVASIVETAGGQLQVINSDHPQSTRDRADTVVDFAVRMRQFPQNTIVATRLNHPKLSGPCVEDFGHQLAKLQGSIETARCGRHAECSDRFIQDALDNFPVLLEAFDGDSRLETIRTIYDWTVTQAPNLAAKMNRRLKSGFVRRCHGDLHLKNIIQLDGRLMAFDGIEFNEGLQWIDVLCEIAFPVMDFVARGRQDLAWRVLNAWLEATGDYQDLDLMRFYLVYRAMVRAKVTWLNPKNRCQQECHPGYGDREPTGERSGPWDKYLDTAIYFAFRLVPQLTIMHGFSGSGKSTIAIKSLDETGGIRIRSDIERHRLVRQLKTGDKYSANTTAQVYEHLLTICAAMIRAGFPVIVDATFLKIRQRQPFQLLASELTVPFHIHHCDADFETLCERIRNRSEDPSEATIAVLKRQIEIHDPLTAEELKFLRDGTGNRTIKPVDQARRFRKKAFHPP